MILIDAGQRTGEHLLQVMLHHFRRIHAAKRGFHRQAAVASQDISSYFNSLNAISSCRSNCGMLHLCCSKKRSIIPRRKPTRKRAPTFVDAP